MAAAEVPLFSFPSFLAVTGSRNEGIGKERSDTGFCLISRCHPLLYLALSFSEQSGVVGGGNGENSAVILYGPKVYSRELVPAFPVLLCMHVCMAGAGWERQDSCELEPCRGCLRQ